MPRILEVQQTRQSDELSFQVCLHLTTPSGVDVAHQRCPSFGMYSLIDSYIIYVKIYINTWT